MSLDVRVTSSNIDAVEPQLFILHSAHNHKVEDGDIEHAFRNAIKRKDLDEGFTMLVGPTAAATCSKSDTSSRPSTTCSSSTP
jgi:hypothetical protein